MKFRSFLIVGASLALAACQPAIPDSGAGVPDPGRGVGFDDPTTLAAREARASELSSPTVPAAPAVGTTALLPAATQSATATTGTARAVSDPQGLDAELAAAAVITGASPRPIANAQASDTFVNASPSNAAPVILNNPGISDENSFDAVAARESIESDAARIASNRQQYEVIQPTALPTRRGNASTQCGGLCAGNPARKRHQSLSADQHRLGVQTPAQLRTVYVVRRGADRLFVLWRARSGSQGAGPRW